MRSGMMCRRTGNAMGNMDKIKTGNPNTRATDNLRVISVSSDESPLSGEECSIAIPHRGQSPGLLFSTPGHIGQKNGEEAGEWRGRGTLPRNFCRQSSQQKKNVSPPFSAEMEVPSSTVMPHIGSNAICWQNALELNFGGLTFGRRFNFE